MKGNEIEEFLDDYPVEGTRANYRSRMNKFFRAIDVKNPNEYINNCRNGRDYEADVNTFWKSMDGAPPLCIISAMSTIKMFLEFNEIDISKKDMEAIEKEDKRSSGKNSGFGAVSL